MKICLSRERIVQKFRHYRKQPAKPQGKAEKGLGPMALVGDALLGLLLPGVGLLLSCIDIRGTGPIKGFAVTLCLGIAINLFTALVGTKVIFDVMNRRRQAEQLSI
jgi:preprotein translocase subunit SecD